MTGEEEVVLGFTQSDEFVKLCDYALKGISDKLDILLEWVFIYKIINIV
jgi:hypothetical protein